MLAFIGHESAYPRRIDYNKYEKSLDNCRAALVSRGPRAPRATDKRKSFVGKVLGSIGPPHAARGAQVSRAARVTRRTWNVTARHTNVS